MFKRKIYAIYKGDEFLCEGTARECAEFLGVKQKTVFWWKSPVNHRRNKGNKKIAIVIEEEEND
jgi:hypothetical protein